MSYYDARTHESYIYISFSTSGVQFKNFAYQQPFTPPLPQGLEIARSRN